MTYATTISDFFLYRLVVNIILGKNQEKKVSEDSRFSGYSGFATSLVFGKIFFQKP